MINFQQRRQDWKNLSFRSKLTLLLVVAAILPVMVATQGIVTLLQGELIKDLQVRLAIQLNVIEGKIDGVKKDERREAQNLANFVESQGWLLNRPEQQAALRNLFSNYVQLDADQSFYLVTDPQGRSIAQYIQEVKDDFSTYPPIPGDELKKTEFRALSLPIGINLGDISIVKDTLNYQRPLSGTELFKSEWLKRLGLERQADIGVRAQKTQGLPEDQQPFPPGTYDIESGKIGLVSMAVQPIQVQGKLVGYAIVGTLLNRNYDLVDRLKQEAKATGCTLFAQDWRVSSISPYSDNKTRQIGTRVSRQVAETVLNQKQVFSGYTNVIGRFGSDLTKYAPIYDHQQILNPIQAKPVGMVSVGVKSTEIDIILNNLRLAGWVIGVGIGMLGALAAFPIAGAFSNSLLRLTKFAHQLGAGDLTASVPADETQDEIGQLQAAFRTMMKNLNSLIRQVQQSGIQIASSTTHLASSGKQLEATVSEQAASSNQVAATAKQIAATSFQLVQTMEAVEQASQATAVAAGDSQADLMLMGTSMRRLASGTNTISNKLGVISDKANNIDSIITTITKVADQTNLLSLNAAIEAEKAGKYGMGFAVVAKEVRRLADQTAVATLDIESMVQQMQAAVTTGVMEMDNFTLEVERCVLDVGNIGIKLETIIEQVQNLTPRFQQVSAGMEVQSQGAQQISEAMLQLTQTAGKTVMSLQEINGAIGELNDAVKGLRQEISHFQVTDN